MRQLRAEYDNGVMVIDSGLRISFHEELPSAREALPAALLFLHGRNAHSGTWRKNLPYFAERGWRAIALTLPRPDYPGVTSAEIMEYSKVAHESLAMLHVKQLDAILGNSMGGWIGMQMCLSRPGLARHLVLEDTAGADSDVVPQIDMPTLIVWGEDDDVLPSSLASLLQSKIRSSIVKMIKDAGHVPHWERPEEFNNMVNEFLTR